MHAASLALAGGSSLLAATSVWLAWFWWLPAIRNTSQKWIDQPLRRLGEIGFDEETVRSRLFFFETLLGIGFVYGFRVYPGPFLTLVLMAVYFHARGLILAHVIDQRERLLRAQTLSLTVALQGLTQSGVSLAQAILQAAPEIPAPLGKQMHRLASNYRLGRPLSEAIGEIRQVLRLDAFSLLVTAMTCAMKQGTPMRDALLGVQETLEHRDRVERQLQAKTSSARTTILLLSASPFFFAGVIWFFMPETIALIFGSQTGKFVLAIIVATFYSGVAWARSLLRLR